MESDAQEKSVKLLIVEGDVNFAYIVKFGLIPLGNYDIQVASNGREGYELWEKGHPNIVLADIKLPIMDGLEMVRKIRKTDRKTLIMFISSLSEPTHVIQGFQAGADNYVKKPCTPEELNYHIKALLRLSVSHPSGNDTAFTTLGKYLYYPSLSLLESKDGSASIHLTPNENIVLNTLCKKKGEIVRKDAIMQLIWQKCDFYSARCLDTMLNKLRKKIMHENDAVQIHTVHNIGIKLIEISEGTVRKL